MSKSLGNVVTPQKVMEQNGADILRLWVVSSDYYNDLRIGPEITKSMIWLIAFRRLALPHTLFLEMKTFFATRM